MARENESNILIWALAPEGLHDLKSV
jgi:hypothetical protein